MPQTTAVLIEPARPDDFVAIVALIETELFAHRGYRVIRRDAVPPVLRSTAEFSRLCPATAACLAKTL
jgi:amino-acid N-acetyltransferase